MPRERELVVGAPAAIEVQRRELARYDARMMYLGFASTVTWVCLSIPTASWLYEALAELGLSGRWWYVAAVALAVTACRFVVLRGYGRIRSRMRRARADASDRARPAIASVAHLSPALSRIVTSLQDVRRSILAPDEHCDAVIDQLRVWVAAVDGLEGDDRDRMRERGLDLSPLRPLLRLAPMTGEARAVWADRAYRRLQAAVPVLDHFEQQLTRMRDDAYR